MSVISDPIGDYLTRIRNASRAGKRELKIPYSQIKVELTRILKQEGYIWGYEVELDGVQSSITISTKFINRTPAITGLKRISRPGLRRYVRAREIPRVLGGMGIAIISTSHGVLTGREARTQNVGGELLAFVW